MAHPLPGELSREHGLALIRQVAEFGRPYPILVLTGGDVLMRAGLYELISAASSIGIPTCVSPPVTPLLTRGAVARIKDVAMERFAMPFKIVRVRPDPRGFTEIDSRSPARRLA
jgi:MoaA/NifB/PqqE/SkfB family radical SAM enzyme